MALIPIWHYVIVPEDPALREVLMIPESLVLLFFHPGSSKMYHDLRNTLVELIGRDVLTRNRYRLHGTPSAILIDRDPVYVSFLERFTEQLGEYLASSVRLFHPETVRTSQKRTFKTLEDMLRSWCIRYWQAIGTLHLNCRALIVADHSSVGEVSYRLAVTSPTALVHNVFHVSLSEVTSISSPLSQSWEQKTFLSFKILRKESSLSGKPLGKPKSLYGLPILIFFHDLVVTRIKKSKQVMNHLGGQENDVWSDKVMIKLLAMGGDFHRPNWIFHIDALTKSMNYKPVVAGNQSNSNAGTKACDDAGKARMETVPGKDYILLPMWPSDPLFSQNLKNSPDAGFKPSREEEKKDAEDPRNESGNPTERKDSEVLSTEEPKINQEKDDNINSTNNINTASDGNNTDNVNAVSSTVNAADIEVNVVDHKTSIELPNDLNMPKLEDIIYSDDDEDDGAEADMNNLDVVMPVSPIPTTRIHKDHPVDQIIGDLNSAQEE
ncbi:hypothetical protein Tco_0893471 [Tanacetum coccineum]|uniref:Uncharacterized protein n=1 Tax=Tanacetum coccineum TaxID=301880 RepID=A0ABQ5CEA9_9ASTR